MRRHHARQAIIKARTRPKAGIMKALKTSLPPPSKTRCHSLELHQTNRNTSRAGSALLARTAIAPKLARALLPPHLSVFPTASVWPARRLRTASYSFAAHVTSQPCDPASTLLTSV